MSEADPNKNDIRKNQAGESYMSLKSIQNAMAQKIGVKREKTLLSMSINGIKLTDEEKSVRARANWDKLRKHVKDKKNTANYFVRFLEKMHEQE